MREPLIFLASGIGPALANHLWQSTVFAAVAGLLTLFLQRNPASVRCGLWLVASMKFLIPFSLLVGLGRLFPKPRPVSIEPQMMVYSAISVASRPFGTLPPVTSPVQHTHWIEGFVTLLPQVLLAVWILGVMAVLFVWYSRWRHLSAALRKAAVAEEGREVDILRRLEADAKAGTRIAVMRSRDMMEPGIFGIFRPAMLWPERLTQRLDDKQIEAILAHELVHVRRHDNLTAAVHMVVEALFWFHPIVWWIESRMVEERERACDEAAARQVGSPDVYAESLLKACRFCLESPLPCVPGIAGADLRKRIVRITTGHIVRKLDFKRKALLCAAGLASLAVPVVLGAAHVSQNESEDASAVHKSLKFAVVSIRRNKTGGQQRFGEATPGGYRMENMFLAAPILTAYVPQTGGAALYADDQVVGLPAWLYSDNDHYDIFAKVDDADLADWQNPAKQPAMLRSMLQSMLAERLKLVVHRSTKEGPVYSLVVGKKGPKFRETNLSEPHPGAYPFPGGGMLSMEQKDGQITVNYFGITIGQLTASLLGQAGRPIQDGTGLTGKYDLTIQKPIPAAVAPGAPLQEASDLEPSAFSIAEQLGLKLEPAKGRVETLVIDHVERPSEN
jgi:bla regulator protein BlaR1